MRGEKGAWRKKSEVKKGCVAIKVGGEGEEKKRFIVPVVHINHPLFLKLLKEAEEEYGFRQEGAITIPCKLDHFHSVQALIHSHHHHSHAALLPCFTP